MIGRRKGCYCHTCARAFDYRGITNHRKAHLLRGESCDIEFTYGERYTYEPTERTARLAQSDPWGKGNR